MTQGVGGSTAERELAQLADRTSGVEAITLTQRRLRIEKAVQITHRTGHGIGLDLHEWTYLVEATENSACGSRIIST